MNLYVIDKRRIALDSSTKREMIGDRLYIRDCILTSAVVSDYLGSEINGWEQLGLDKDKKYGILRPLEEIEKALHTYGGMATLYNHAFVDYTNPNKNAWMG